jgi:trehalose 6-phosphate phosphatase
MDVFSGLDLKKIALLLDVDGTIVDIGPSPNEVQVSDTLLRSLARLHELVGWCDRIGERPAYRRS